MRILSSSSEECRYTEDVEIFIRLSGFCRLEVERMEHWRQKENGEAGKNNVFVKTRKDGSRELGAKFDKHKIHL